MRNAGLLQARQGVLVVVDLLALRFVLAALGETSYGVFSAVTGVVTLFSLLHGVVQTQAVRFLSVGFVRQEEGTLARSFSAVLFLTSLLVVLIVGLGETAALQFVSNRMSFPPAMRRQAVWVFHIGLATVALQTLQLPFVALVMASERLGILLKTTALDVLIALTAAGFVCSCPAAGVVGYAAVLCGGAALLLTVYGGCCHVTYPEIRIAFGCRMVEFREQGLFLLWSLLSTCANTLKYQGVGVLISLYAGVLYNASWGVAMKVGFCIGILVGGFQLAFQPKLVRLWRKGERVSFWRQTAVALRWTFLSTVLLTLPLVVCPSRSLALWLGDNSLPELVPVVRCIALHYLVDALTAPLTTAIVATGRIARYQIGVSVAMGSGFVFAWLALAAGWPVWTAVGAVALSNALSLLQRLVYMRNCMGLGVRRFVRELFIPSDDAVRSAASARPSASAPSAP